MISLDLSLVRVKDADRAWLGQAMAEFEQRQGMPEVVPTTARCPDIETAFNNRTQKGRRGEVSKPREVKIAELAPGLTRHEASRKFHLSQHDLQMLADTMGFAFKRGHLTDQAFKDGDAALVEQITSMRDNGLNRSQVQKHIGMSYQKFHRLLSEYSIDFPKASNGGSLKRVRA